MCLEPLGVAVDERMIFDGVDFSLSLVIAEVEILRVGIHLVIYRRDVFDYWGHQWWVIIAPSLSETGCS